MLQNLKTLQIRAGAFHLYQSDNLTNLILFSHRLTGQKGASLWNGFFLISFPLFSKYSAELFNIECCPPHLVGKVKTDDSFNVGEIAEILNFWLTSLKINKPFPEFWKSSAAYICQDQKHWKVLVLPQHLCKGTLGANLFYYLKTTCMVHNFQRHLLSLCVALQFLFHFPSFEDKKIWDSLCGKVDIIQETLI